MKTVLPSLRNDGPEARASASSLATALRLHPLVARVLAARGVTMPDAARSFLTPRLSELTRPDGMVDREAAADRIARAVRGRERVVIFGDYDVDGITSCSLLTRVLRRLGGDVVPQVASRFGGGYGLSDAAVDRVLAVQPTLVITCDCGTSDHPRLARLRERGIDVIVVDHHKVPDEPLPALAFLNPHRPDCGFPYKHLASVGIAFSIAAAVRQRLDAAFDLRPYLDLVALGTIADVASLVGDNRVLTRAGLNRISDGDGSPGVRALVSEAKVRNRLTARDVAFSLGPMLNAPGRLGSPVPTLELLLEEDPKRAASLARALAQANEERKAVSSALIADAIKQVKEVYGQSEPAGIVLAGDGWHHGMGGIVAGRLVERYGVPVVVVALDGHEGVGSVRSPRGVRLYDAIARCKSDLLTFGGHDAAAGLRIHRDRIDSFRAAFSEAVGGAPRESFAAPLADAEITEADLVGGLGRDLASLDPTGEGNPDPKVIARGARVTEARAAGETHLRMTFALGRRSLGSFVFDGQARRERGELPRVGTQVDLFGALRPDPFTGPEAVQIDLVSFAD